MIKAVIFDMDGLMIDSERTTFECYGEVMKKMNLTISEDFYTTLLGKNVAHGRKQFKKKYGEDFPFDDVIRDTHKLINEIFETRGVPIKKGLNELLDYLKDNQYKLIVASSSSRDRVEHLLTLGHVFHYFDDCICGNEVTHSKPDPEIFIKACEKLGVKPDEAIVLEDSEAGIQAAYAGHIPVICVPDMKYPDEEFVSKTTKILDSLLDVIDYLK